jgi:hypothetical protein
MIGDPFGVAALGIVTGMVFVTGSLTVVLVIVLAQLRNRRLRAEMLHRERLMAIEKGVTLPPDYSDLAAAKRRRPYVAGLIWTSVGVGLMLWGVVGRDRDLYGVGFIPLLVGLALLLGDWLTSRRAAKANGNGSRAYPAPNPADRSPGSLS